MQTNLDKVSQKHIEEIKTVLKTNNINHYDINIDFSASAIWIDYVSTDIIDCFLRGGVIKVKSINYPKCVTDFRLQYADFMTNLEELKEEGITPGIRFRKIVYP